jgi:lysozyme
MSIIIDISSNNSPPDFGRVKHDGVLGVIIKATEGLTFNNPRLESDWERAAKAGLVVGSYHFAREDTHPGKSGAQAEAQHYVRTMMRIPGHGKGRVWHKGNFLPILDFEKGTGDHKYSPWRDAFYDEVRRLVGHYSILYTSPGFNNWAKPNVKDNRLWVAHYTSASQPNQVPGYSGYDLWQFTDKRVVAGCHEPVDASRLPQKLKAMDRILCHRNG